VSAGISTCPLRDEIYPWDEKMLIGCNHHSAFFLSQWRSVASPVFVASMPIFPPKLDEGKIYWRKTMAFL
jgi:hypothetical protein